MLETLDFILASASPRRKELCAQKGYRFRVEVSQVEEPPTEPFASPEAYATHTAWLKANALPPSNHFVVGADTIVAHAGQILGKPAGRDHARHILTSLMGTRHRVITGVCIVLPQRQASLVDHVTTYVEMRPMSPAELNAYLDTGLWEGKAGAYGIQDQGDPFVKAVDGSFSNVVGLPMERLAELLERARRCA